MSTVSPSPVVPVVSSPERDALRGYVRTAYDLQKVRVQLGLRLVKIVKDRLTTTTPPAALLAGRPRLTALITTLRNEAVPDPVDDTDAEAPDPSAKAPRDSKVAAELMKLIVEEIEAERPTPVSEVLQQARSIIDDVCDRLGSDRDGTTAGLVHDAIIERMNKMTYTDTRDTSLPRARFKPSALFSNYTEYCLAWHFSGILRNEKSYFSRMEGILEQFHVWNQWLSTVSGIGPAMGGVILAECPPDFCRTVSALHKYCGLDVVKPVVPVAPPVERVCVSCGGVTMSPNNYLTIACDGCGAVIQGDKCDDLRLAYPDYRAGRSRRAEHLVDREYKAADGTTQTRKSITFSPFIKTKLLGVAAGSFLKCANKVYAPIYYGYKERLQNHHFYGVKWGNTSDAHRHQMSLRYMMKMFLRDLHTNARGILGLPVRPSYAEEKLGLVHGVTT